MLLLAIAAKAQSDTIIIRCRYRFVEPAAAVDVGPSQMFMCRAHLVFCVWPVVLAC